MRKACNIPFESTTFFEQTEEAPLGSKWTRSTLSAPGIETVRATRCKEGALCIFSLNVEHSGIKNTGNRPPRLHANTSQDARSQCMIILSDMERKGGSKHGQKPQNGESADLTSLLTTPSFPWDLTDSEDYDSSWTSDVRLASNRKL
jgi:hypothetical protein